MNKRIFIIIISILLSSSVFAKTSIDQAITNAAVDIADKSSAKTILMIDDFESPTPAMTLYIREQLADTIFAEDGLIQIVTREHMDKIEKELKFQNSGVVSEKTILSVAERLGARFVVFGKLEEFNSGFILRVRMLDVKTGAYLFRKTYEFGYSQKTAQLLGNASTYKKVAIGGIGEINKNSIAFVAPAAGVTFDVGAIPWIMDREDAVYWVDTSGMIFFDQGDERNAGAAAFAEYLLKDDVCSEFLESVGGLSPYRTVYESQAYRKNRRGFDEITMAASDEIQRADFVLMSDAKRRELDELLLYIIDKRVTAEDAVRIFAGS